VVASAKLSATVDAGLHHHKSTRAEKTRATIVACRILQRDRGAVKAAASHPRRGTIDQNNIVD